MTKKLTKEECVSLLQEKAKQLDRYPKKADFDQDEIVKIKAYFGPWPRALEAAGIKEGRLQEKLEKKIQKRIRAKIRIREMKIQKKTLKESENDSSKY